MLPSFLEFADLWSGVRIPACCTLPACRVWPVPSHTGRCPPHSWQHYCQRWVWRRAGYVITNNINNSEFLSCSTQGIVRRFLASPVTACWRPWLEWRRLAVWLKSFPPSRVFNSAHLYHGQKPTELFQNFFFFCLLPTLQTLFEITTYINGLQS